MSTGPEPADLGIAIVERFHGTSDLTAGFAGGIYRSKANPEPGGSQLVFRITNARPAFVSGASEFLRQVVRFTVMSGDSNEAGRLRQVVEDVYGKRSIEHAGGWTTPLYVVNRSEDEVTKPADPANMSYKAVVDFEFSESRSD